MNNKYRVDIAGMRIVQIASMEKPELDKDGDRRIGKRKYPLRRFIEITEGDYKGTHFSRLSLLECGHKVPVSRDMYAETSPVSQRCRLCWEEQNLTSYPLQSVPEGWVQDMVVAEDFEIGWQVYDDELRQWEDCAEWYYNSINGVRRIIAIPILQRGVTIAPAADKGEEKFYAVEYAGFWHIQKTPYYESLEEGTNILNAEEVGYRESEQYANLIAELLNKHYEK